MSKKETPVFSQKPMKSENSELNALPNIDLHRNIPPPKLRNQSFDNNLLRDSTNHSNLSINLRKKKTQHRVLEPK